MSELRIQTTKKREVVDITEQVQEQIAKAGSGLAHVFVLHTTAAITAADLDPGTDLDLLDFLDSLVPDIQWRHPHDPSHTPDHLLAALVGPNLAVPFTSGRLELGSWQHIVLLEFDGPRDRTVIVSKSN